jgi:hypothetical protein
MPAITHDAIVPNNGDLASMKAQTSALAQHLSQINAHFIKLPSVNPGPPGTTDIAANVNQIIALALQIQQVGQEWLQTPAPTTYNG